MMTKGERNMVKGLEEELARVRKELHNMREFLMTKHPAVLKAYETKMLIDVIWGVEPVIKEVGNANE